MMVAERCLAVLLLLGAWPGVLAQGGVELECRKHIAQYQLGLATGKAWAWRMFDSATKLPDGLLRGSLIHLGHYDECVDTQGPPPLTGGGSEPQFTGQYCRVVFTNISAVPPPVTSWLHLEQLRQDLQDVGELDGLSEDALEQALQDLTESVTLPASRSIMHSLRNDDKSTSSGSVVGFQWSVCAPSSCGPEGVAQLAAINFGLMTGGALDFQVQTTRSSCFYYGDPRRDLDQLDWVMVWVLSGVAVLVVASTVYEYWLTASQRSVLTTTRTPSLSPAQEVLSSFSLRSNCQRLFAAPRRAGPLGCLNGVRVLSMAWVVLCHRYTLHSYMPSTNTLDMFTKFMHRWGNMVVLNGALAVDTFFLLSGLLASYAVTCNLLIRGRRFGFKDLPQFYIYRYLRLTAPLAMMVFFSATLVDHVSHGPMWGFFVSRMVKDVCRRNWWETLLYVNNYLSTDGICVGQSWYLSVDMQLMWATPLVLFMLVRWPRYTLGLIVALTGASAAATFAVTFIHELSWSFSILNNAEKASDFSNYVYVNTPMRASPFLIGLGLGYLVARSLHPPIHVDEGLKAPTVPRPLVLLGWVLSTAVCLTVLFVLARTYHTDFEYSRIGAAFYAGLHRVAWAVGIGWVIYACATGNGGPVSSVLAWRLWQPLSRLSYCVFLVHLTIMFMEGGTWRNARHFGSFDIVHGFLGDLLLVLPPAMVLHLTVEAPCIRLLRATFARRTRADIIPNWKQKTDAPVQNEGPSAS